MRRRLLISSRSRPADHHVHTRQLSHLRNRPASSCSLPARAGTAHTLSTGASTERGREGDALDLDELEGDDDEGLGRARGAAGRDGEALVHLALAGEREELLAPEVVRRAAQRRMRS